MYAFIKVICAINIKGQTLLRELLQQTSSWPTLASQQSGGHHSSILVERRVYGIVFLGREGTVMQGTQPRYQGLCWATDTDVGAITFP